MKIQAICPTCQTKIAVAVENAGKKAKCPTCGGIIPIPTGTASPPKSAQQSRVASATPPPPRQPIEPLRQARRVQESPPESPPKRKSPTPKQRSRRQEPPADDIWSQPLTSYSSPAIEEEHYEAFGIAPKEKSKTAESGSYSRYHEQREVGTHNSYTPPSLMIPLIMAGIGLGSAILFGGIGLAFPPAAFIGMAIGGSIGFILMLWGGLRILGNAFEEDSLTGILYIMFWPFALYFLFSRWEVNQHPFLINLMGTLVFFVSMILPAIALPSS